MYEVTDEQKKAIVNLQAALAFPTPVPEHDLFRFLVVNAFDVAKTKVQFEKYVAWRKEKDIDTILARPCAKGDLIDRIIPYAYHKFDKSGHPIYIEKTGKIATTALANHLSIDEFVNSHVVGMEKLKKSMEDQSKKTGKVIDQLTSILDLEGLSLGHMQAVNYLRAVAAIDHDMYPDRIAKVLIINAPWITPVAYNTVKVFLDPTVQARLQILSSTAELLDHIDVSDLPAEYGGQCKCAGGCCPVADTSDLAGVPMTEAEKHKSLGLTRVNVPAGSVMTEELECGAEGSAFTWFFESEGGYDVDFSVKVVGGAEGGKEIVPTGRICTSKGCHQSSDACKLVFTWSNEFSYFNSKDIQFFIGTSNMGDVHMTDCASSSSSADQAK